MNWGESCSAGAPITMTGDMTLDIGKLPTGCYVLLLDEDGRSIRSRFVKE